MPHGPAGTDKAAAEQKLLDTAMEQYPHLFTMDRIWLMDRNYHGAPRIARLIARTHVLIRLKSDIPLKRISPVLADGSYLAEISGDGVTVTVRVIEYWVTVEGQEVPEMFCLVTDLTDWREYPAAELAALYKWRWDGSETALREAKASLDGAGPSAGPMLRSGSPGLVRQELAAWAAGNEMTRGVARAAALAAVPARKGRRAGHARPGPGDLPRPHPPRRDRRDPRRENQLHGAGQGTRANTGPSSTGTGTAPARPSAPAPSPAPAAAAPPPGPPRPSSPSPTRQPDQRKHQPDQRKHRKQSSGKQPRPARGTGRHPARHAGRGHVHSQELLTVTKTRNLAPTPKCLNPVALSYAVVLLFAATRGFWPNVVDRRAGTLGVARPGEQGTGAFR